MSEPERGRGRGGGRGRPSLLELMRREAYRQASGDDPASLSEDRLPAAPVARPLPVAPPAPVALPLPTVSQDLLKSLCDRLPALPTHPLGEHVTRYAMAAEGQRAVLQEQDHVRFAVNFWNPVENVWHSAARVAQAAGKDVLREKLRRAERRLVAAAELAEREAQHQAIAAIASAGEQVELLCFIEGARYDEATSVLTVAQPSLDIIVAAGATPDDISDHLLSVLAQDAPKEAVPAKVFQTESRWVALVAVPTGDPGRPKRLHAISSESITAPQLMQQNNAASVAAALTSSTVVRQKTVQGFRWKMRLVCSDRGSPNLAAERMILKSRPEWHLLFCPCEVHMSTSCQSKALQLMDGAVTKYIRTALSLRLGGWMRLFRRCMVKEIFETLEILEGAPSAEVALHRRRAVAMFTKSRPDQRKNAAILSCLPNGDWRLGDRVQVFVPPGKPWNKLSVALLVAKALMTALAGSNFMVFNRKRWTNNDHAVNQLGLLESCHRLFSRTYKRWLLAVGYSGSLKHLLVDESPAPAPAPPPAPMMIADGDAEAVEGGAGVRV